jgi:hypothetical protein
MLCFCTRSVQLLDSLLQINYWASLFQINYWASLFQILSQLLLVLTVML